jgi:hypothetical protein
LEPFCCLADIKWNGDIIHKVPKLTHHIFAVASFGELLLQSRERTACSSPRSCACSPIVADVNRFARVLEFDICRGEVGQLSFEPS